MSRYGVARHDTTDDTAACALRHDVGCARGRGQAATRPARPAIQPRGACDTALVRATTRPRHGQPGRSARSLSLVSFGLNALFLSHCLGHCSQGFQKEINKSINQSNQIKSNILK